MATLRLRDLADGPAYYLQWRDESGKRHTKSLGYVKENVEHRYKKYTYISHHDAQVELKGKEIELMGSSSSFDESSPLYKDYVIEYLKYYKAMHGIKSYELVEGYLLGRTYKKSGEFHIGTFAKLIGDRRLDDITKKLLEDYQTQRLSEYANVRKQTPVRPTTIEREINVLKAMLNHAMANEVCTKYNLRYLRKLTDLKSAPKGYFKPREMEAIYNTAENPHWWKFLVNTGLRLGEMMNLRWSNIDYDEEIIWILSTAQERTKSAKWRAVPFNDNILDSLEDFKRIGTDNKYVIPRIGNRLFGDTAKSVIENAGLEGTTHKFRHTFCTMHVKAKTPTFVIQKMAGHASIETTQRYVDACADDLKGISVNI